jgi:hypothetical protein
MDRDQALTVTGWFTVAQKRYPPVLNGTVAGCV